MEKGQYEVGGIRMKVLIVEDDRSLSNAIVRILTINKYESDTAFDGIQALELIEANDYDLVITDIMMPKMDGIELTQEIRKRHNNVPILILTAKSEIDDKVAGLDAGADDYLTKPFSLKEFLARMRSLLRRKDKAIENYSLGNLELDRETFELRTPEGSSPLTDTEYRLMEYLMRNKNSVLSTERLMENIWGYDSDVEINVVWAYLSSLRKKLASIKADVTIKAMRGVGYKLAKIEE